MQPAKRKSAKPQNVEEYLAVLEAPTRERVEQLRALIRSVVPQDATEVISYRIPAFRTTKVIVWYAGFAKHCSVFPGASVIARFKHELSDYTVSKGTVQFPLDEKLPSGLIKKLIKARVAEVTSASPSR